MQLQLEIGVIKVESKVSLASINLWLKLTFYPQGLASLILQDSFESEQIKAVQSNLLNLGFSPSSVFKMKYNQLKQILKQRIKDIEWQADLGKAPAFLLPVLNSYIVIAASYLTQLQTPTHQRGESRGNIAWSCCAGRRPLKTSSTCSQENAVTLVRFL